MSTVPARPMLKGPRIQRNLKCVVGAQGDRVNVSYRHVPILRDGVKENVNVSQQS